MNDTAPAPGTVYLIHFDACYRHARHYIGWAADLAARLDAHRKGHGSRLMEVITAAGITWQLARTWEGGRTRERAIKNRKEAPRLCPLCTPQPRPVTAGRSGLPAPAPAPVILPVPEQRTPRERGIFTAGQFLEQRTGWNPRRLAEVFEAITGPYRGNPRHTPDQDEEHAVFTEIVLARISQLRATWPADISGEQS